MQQGGGETVYPIVGLRSTEHIADNLAALALRLDEQDIADIAAVLEQSQGPKGDAYSFERGLPA
jgi:aryl-alcohol dehydrogenase-like predicted oxidoreductase